MLLAVMIIGIVTVAPSVRGVAAVGVVQVTTALAGSHPKLMLEL